MGQEPSDIRAEIEETRARVGDEVDALSYKTDVPARVGDYVDDKKQAVTGKLTDVKDAVAGTASNVLPTGEKVGRLKDTAERNPLGLAIGGVAVGFVAGLLASLHTDREQGDGRDVRQGRRCCQGDRHRSNRERQTSRPRHRRQRHRTRTGSRLNAARKDAGIAHEPTLGRSPWPLAPCDQV